jgi:hypothetical protein
MWSIPIALSFKKLSSTATLCCRVRRASDNAETDIGFIGNECDFAAILAFAPSQACNVVRIYNQGTGGSGYDVFQTSASSQPTIISSTLNQITEDSNGNKTPLFFSTTQRNMDFDVKDFLKNKAIGTSMIVYENDVTAGRDILYFSVGGVNSTRFMATDGRVTASRHSLFSRRLDGDSASILTAGTNYAVGVKQRTDIVDWGNSDAFIRRNGVQVASSTSHGTAGNTSNTDSLVAGLGNKLTSISPKAITEVLMFNTDISADLAAIEADQISRYVI